MDKVEYVRHMIEVYNWHIDQWLEDSPLTISQEMSLKYSGETLEETLRTDLERLAFWKSKLEQYNDQRNSQ